MRSKIFFTLFFVLSFGYSQQGIASLDGYIKRIERTPNTALLVESVGGLSEISIRAEEPLIPASTLKILTAYLAIERWGIDHRFQTSFYRRGDQLWVKGSGDPFITSEELSLISESLKPKLEGLKIRQLGLDNTLFRDSGFSVRGDSDNPYDAGQSALAVNFNSVYLKRKGKHVSSAEPQTPLTPLARSLGSQYVPGNGKSKRISLPGGDRQSAQYFAEVFSALLFTSTPDFTFGPVPDDATLVYQHRSSKTLKEVLQAMLKYSNNFIANQIYLMLGREDGTGVVTAQQSQNYISRVTKNYFGWDNFIAYDGAGLSRENRMTAAQLMELLVVFKPWIDLLPDHKQVVKAKTGTLTGIRTYAGYVRSPQGHWRAFSLLLNKQLSWRFRFRLAEALSTKAE